MFSIENSRKKLDYRPISKAYLREGWGAAIYIFKTKMFVIVIHKINYI